MTAKPKIGTVLVKGLRYLRVVKVSSTPSLVYVQTREGSTGRYTKALELVNWQALKGWKVY